ncbi:hypothetical protein [Oceanirhabdus seepicola]|uniref:DUF4340 domain-containing protein n=1 Tax=Oceanirhabdus seepicola TaxID=2828781 RepID=A0A9J6NXG5_9CLOT|nr:hypothetical protein [Oceanirhabdus seepicola]MCM1989199.1 hypothetical protein [Oceanirhabdus seepicola]
MKKLEISKGKILLIICIALLAFFIGNKIHTNKVIKNMEKQIGSIIEPVIERIKLTTIEELDNGQEEKHKYKVKFKSVDLSSYREENIKKIISGDIFVNYTISDEKEREWTSGRTLIPVIREDLKSEFEIDWRKITSTGAHDFFIIDIINDYENHEYENYEELMKGIISFNSQDEEKFSEHSGSGRDNRDDIKFDEKGNLIKEDKLNYMMVWTGVVASMKLECEYNLKEFTGEENGDGIIINIKKKAVSRDPLWFAQAEDIEKIDFWVDKEDGDGQESIEISDKEKIIKIYNLLTSFEYEYLLNEQYYGLTDSTRADMHISFELKGHPYFHVIINKNGVFISNQQGIISSEKSREILEKLMEIAKE